MFTDSIKVPTVSTALLDLELGTEIYAKLMKLWTINNVIALSIYDPENIIAVNVEVDRILANRGKTELDTAATYDEETLEILTEATYKEIPVVSEFLDIKKIFTDFPLETNVE